MTPFLTDLDPQAAIKGSRDPLGVQTVWARLGRQVVGNLTTVTTSVRDFTTTILGYYFAERVANEAGGDVPQPQGGALALYGLNIPATKVNRVPRARLKELEHSARVVAVHKREKIAQGGVTQSRRELHRICCCLDP